MLSFLNLKCARCDSEYTLAVEELKVLVLFKCFECGQYNAYVAGHMVELNQDVMENGLASDKQRQIKEALQLWALEFAGNVLNNVARIIDVNVNSGFPDAGSSEVVALSEDMGDSEDDSGLQLHPTTVWRDAPAISDEEFRDFVDIDLNLIDNKRYFKKFFDRDKN